MTDEKKLSNEILTEWTFQFEDHIKNAALTLSSISDLLFKEKLKSITISHCYKCAVPLFKSQELISETGFISLCTNCFDKLVEIEWKYVDLCK